MAKVFAPFVSFKAKGKFGGILQVQPEPYTKGPPSWTKPVLFEVEQEYPDGSKSIVTDFIFPITGAVSNLCEMDRIMKMTPIKGSTPPVWMTDYKRKGLSFDDWAKKQHLAFKEAKEFLKTLNEDQKTSWKVFGQVFCKQDLCTLAIVPVVWADIFMSFNMFLNIANKIMAPWAPVMDASLSAEAAAKGWKTAYWYYDTKKRSLRKAWALYRKGKYTISKVMSITESWNKYKKWLQLKGPIMNAAWQFWKVY